MRISICRFSILIFLLPFFFSGCNYRERETALEQKEAALTQREQEVTLKEKELQLKEEALLERERTVQAPPARNDTTAFATEKLTGIWGVKMVCTETTCPGSAVGDTKSEQWTITKEGDQLLAKAMAGDKLARIYSGFYTGNTLELVEVRSSTDSQPATKMVVRLRLTNETTMEGQREIIRENNCKILYQLQLDKQ